MAVRVVYAHFVAEGFRSTDGCISECLIMQSLTNHHLGESAGESASKLLILLMIVDGEQYSMVALMPCRS